MSKHGTVVLGLFNPKSPSNVGAVLRAAGCYQADEVRYVGERFARASRYSTDTKNVGSSIPLLQVDELSQGLPEDMAIICVELAEGAVPLPAFTHPEKALYVFGPEDGSIPQAVVDKASQVVYVPTIGCMNLAATVNVLLYDRLAKSDLQIDDVERIKASRDVNNRLVVRA
ncbi:RNA methyltransferase [Marinobacterium mangrovicola]|uniref:tRNA(Leu) C34 or U34 (Ribose-2'-O)-methylase TrmL n=1 Tax=Marinobacterium mangrovicola TaxID=1476959 RepID=A0A4R1GBS4_9GAMM|nr:RNA methyltransferase [Marinobacterium mangrovicola]TCK04233.1 tRNA(Leu) C34 or U34 (ribose-2'-O)-methylase TrmL [Marinobacterium mangrovicola]